MSHDTSLDDETKRILAEVDTDDSKEVIKIKKNDEGHDIDDDGAETNTKDTADTEW